MKYSKLTSSTSTQFGKLILFFPNSPLNEGKFKKKFFKIQNFSWPSKLEMENKNRKFDCSFASPSWFRWEIECAMVAYCSIGYMCRRKICRLELQDASCDLPWINLKRMLLKSIEKIEDLFQKWYILEQLQWLMM